MMAHLFLLLKEVYRSEIVSFTDMAGNGALRWHEISSITSILQVLSTQLYFFYIFIFVRRNVNFFNKKISNITIGSLNFLFSFYIGKFSIKCLVSSTLQGNTGQFCILFSIKRYLWVR